ncbi:hypothetical protein [Amycolatopsis sp. NPDC051102]|uniref:hypothetical protein n=1 Tax=Amycolatopsis sp. NPDC051102 TaxID=3155163 RepID=UPI00344119E0
MPGRRLRRRERAPLPILSVGAAALGWLPLDAALFKLLLFVVEMAIALAVVAVKLLAH